MGLGKTEAALYAAYKMLEEGKATGIYFALPTQLTSNKLLDRFNDYLKQILKSQIICMTQAEEDEGTFVWATLRNRVIFMDVGGRILEDCSKEEFFNNPDARQPRTKDFLNKILQH
jgi:ABC-type polar amino acid transport system ATPase subunit